MNVLNMVVIGLVAFTIVYMILKAIAVSQDKRNIERQENEQITHKTEIEIEIKSRDLYVKAENLIATCEVYALQAEQLLREIDRTQDKIDAERKSAIKDEGQIQELISKSLKLQERKCNLESKMIRINSELDKIAREEYRRQTLGR